MQKFWCKEGPFNLKFEVSKVSKMASIQDLKGGLMKSCKIMEGILEEVRSGKSKKLQNEFVQEIEKIRRNNASILEQCEQDMADLHKQIRNTREVMAQILELVETKYSGEYWTQVHLSAMCAVQPRFIRNKFCFYVITLSNCSYTAWMLSAECIVDTALPTYFFAVYICN